MCDFLSEAFDSDTIAAQARMEEKDTYVYVEGMDDVDFWHKLFNDDRIDISATSREENNKSHKGKSALRKLLPQANKYLIIAIDSDFDFLCPQNSQAAIDFNACRHVIQTQFYSKENITFQPKSVDLNIEKTSLVNEKIASDYKTYIEKYSMIIYDTFVKFLFLRNLRIKPITSKYFHSQIIPNMPIFNDRYELKNDPFVNVRKKIRDMDILLTQEIHKIDNFESELTLFKSQLLDKGLSAENTYCFINGHIIEDSIINNYINGKIRSLKRKITDKIRSECGSDRALIENRCKEASNLLEKKHNFFTRINDCSEKYNNRIVEEIKTKFLEIRQ
ncbi:hypothetical protein ACJEQI_15320 [Klebsiella variicola]|uniref:hypothetical protein n=1 Tax=Klebsiella variicola TaxID=244366 RepID=UPI003871A99E